ncbi:MAG: SAM-dependent methyltransferase [Firmicutes bacterium]|nr:SAM-dependent methyltransferase [Bacillota bacterium]
MEEKQHDRLLNIKTRGLREWRDPGVTYNRYEPTPYSALESLFQVYKLSKTDKMVDFGCGRGRVAFYVHNRFQVPVVGIEANERTYEEALRNKATYRLRAQHIKAPIRLVFGLAEHYEVEPEDNKFYFFNPFSVSTFKLVTANIMTSVKKKRRPVDIILYYPLPKYKKILQTKTPFRLLTKIRIPRETDKTKKFLVYRCR